MFFKQKEVGQSGKDAIVHSILRNLKSDENVKKEELLESTNVLSDSIYSLQPLFQYFSSFYYYLS